MDVAEYLLGAAGHMTAMKTQKLLYYVQAWSLVWREKPLFDDRIEAWAAGPVIPTVYQEHRGRYLVGPGDLVPSPRSLDDEERAICDVVLRHYGHLSAEALSDLTHVEEPWRRARDGLAATERGTREIDPLIMADFYTALGRAP